MYMNYTYDFLMSLLGVSGLWDFTITLHQWTYEGVVGGLFCIIMRLNAFMYIEWLVVMKDCTYNSNNLHEYFIIIDCSW